MQSSIEPHDFNFVLKLRTFDSPSLSFLAFIADKDTLPYNLFLFLLFLHKLKDITSFVNIEEYD
jgi:hypothetical protein